MKLVYGVKEVCENGLRDGLSRRYKRNRSLEGAWLPPYSDPALREAPRFGNDRQRFCEVAHKTEEAMQVGRVQTGSGSSFLNRTGLGDAVS